MVFSKVSFLGTVVLNYERIEENITRILLPDFFPHLFWNREFSKRSRKNTRLRNLHFTLDFWNWHSLKCLLIFQDYSWMINPLWILYVPTFPFKINHDFYFLDLLRIWTFEEQVYQTDTGLKLVPDLHLN